MNVIWKMEMDEVQPPLQSSKGRGDSVVRKRQVSVTFEEEKWCIKWKGFSRDTFTSCSVVKMNFLNLVLISAVVVLLFSVLTVGVFTAFPRFIILILSSIGVYSEYNENNSNLGLSCVNGEGSYTDCKSEAFNHLGTKRLIEKTFDECRFPNTQDRKSSGSAGFFDTSISIRHKQRLPIEKGMYVLKL